MTAQTTAHTQGGTPASGSRMGAGTGSFPRAGSSSGAAPLRNNNAALLQVVLFWAGAILMPLGIVAIILGYYGASNTPYQYEQFSYLVSGGLLGLGLTFLGGFLYFGAWLARIAADGRESSKRLADTLLVLADVTSRAAALDDRGVDTAALPVTAADSTTVHRRDCALIAHRDDLRPAADRPGLTSCRVCRP
jgi:hypothetical protein